MFLKCIFLLFISITHFIPIQLYAQERESDTIKTQKKIDSKIDTLQNFKWKPSTSLYLELLGKGFYSINVDFRKKETHAISLGIQYVEDAFIPSFMYYHFSGTRHRFEIGGGASGVFTRNEGLAGMMVHGVIGYRYQKKKGLLFRVGFTPFLGIPFTNEGKFAFVPWIGLSLGYSL